MNAGTTKRQHSNARETRCVLCGSTDSVERHHVGGRQHSRTGSSSHQTSRECQARLPRIPVGSANDSRLRSCPHDPEGASSMGSRRGSRSSDSVHRQPLRLGGLRTHDRSLATNLSAFETCNTTFQLLDLSAEGWLGDVESFRGATKITLLRNSNEISEMTKLGPLVHLAPALD